MIKLPFENVLIVDGSYLLHRSYHTHLHLCSSNGEPTGALYGTLQSLYSYYREFSPLQIVVALDTVRTSFRNKMYPDYKANRLERDEALQSQFVLLKEFCEKANIPCLDHDDYEADDLIGAVSKRAVERGYSPFIVTGDKDMFQLINDNIKVLYISRNKLELIDEEVFKTKYQGLTPDKLVEIKGLQGDSSDNIPGVRGVGEKTALKLIGEYSTIDNLYENIENIKGKLKERLVEDKDNAYLSKKLSIIKKDLEIEFPDKRIYNLYNHNVNSFLHSLDIQEI